MEDYLGKLFKTEREIKELLEQRERTGATVEPDEILKLRRQKSAPVFAAFKHWVEDLLPGAPPQSALGKALAYTIKQWPKLVRYIEHPDVPAHNNYIENIIRPFSQGRRVWLFANNPLGATASANLYSLVATARANGLQPAAYLNFLFEKLPAAETVEALEALLPWNARSSLPAPRRAA